MQEDFLTVEQQERLLKSTTNKKHRLLILLMLDAGLRVTEARTLKWENCDFRKKIITVKSLKKKDKDKDRIIPISSRLYDAFAVVIEEVKEVKGYIFEGRGGNPIGRSSVNMMLKRIEEDAPSLTGVHPHKLRHTFATNLRSKDAKLEDIKDLLGHERIDTTLIYAHANTDRHRELIEASGEKKSFIQRVKEKLFSKDTKRINLVVNSAELFGRDKELKQIQEFVNKDINVIITGATGIGKTHLLKSLKFDKKTLLIDDCKEFKKTIVGILLHLFEGDKESISSMLYKTSDSNLIEKKVSAESLNNLIQLILDSCDKQEYILKIGDIENATPTVLKAIERLKEHFTIITTAKEVKFAQASFAWNFEKVELKVLDRVNSIRLINSKIGGLEIIDFDAVLTKVYETSEGNPRMITELCDRIAKENVISIDSVTDICDSYIGRQTREIDMSFVLLLVLGGFAVLRYLGKETGEKQLQFVGGCIMIVLLFARYFFSYSKRKVV